MRKFALFLCSCALLLPFSASAAMDFDSPDAQTAQGLPHIIATGLKAYAGGGADEAVSAWVRGSVIDGSSQANILHQAQNLYGPYRSFEVLGTRQFGSRTQIVYLTLDYDKGPLFAKFVAYRSDQGWILASLDFSTKDDILPELPFATSGSQTSSAQP
jgi:hypothetical protein